MKKYLVLFVLILIQGCSSGGGDTAAVTPTNTDCVLGTSKVGDCSL